MSNEETKRDGFSSKWGFILACIGSAVGMGNIWRFPIMVQKYGGMTFLIPYFIFVILIASSGVMEEFALGRRAAAGPVGAFGMCTEERTGKRRPGELIGAIPIIGALMLAIGYTVVLGWIFKYTWLAISGGLFAMGQDMSIIGPAFDATSATLTNANGEAFSFVQSVGAMFSSGLFGIGNGVWQLIGLVVSMAIMAMGVAGGIEKANKVMMPVLFGLFLVLAIYIGTLPGASAGYKYILTLNPAGLAKPDLWVFAFGQAFFSLSVAGNGSVIYGSYLSKSEDIPSSARNVEVFDTIAALLAAVVIIPAMAVVLGEGINDVKGGPGLMFVYLVNVFNAMPAGRIIGAIFYICILFAGVSSIVNLYEAPIAFLQEQFKFKRAAAVGTIGVIGLVVSIAIQPWTSQWMDVVSIYICPLGAALAGVMFFWVLGKEKAVAAVNEGAKKPIGGWFFPLGKWVYVICAVLALILGVMYGGIG